MLFLVALSVRRIVISMIYWSSTDRFLQTVETHISFLDEQQNSHKPFSSEQATKFYTRSGVVCDDAKPLLGRRILGDCVKQRISLQDAGR